jgi:hypothetical protein
VEIFTAAPYLLLSPPSFMNELVRPFFTFIFSTFNG